MSDEAFDARMEEVIVRQRQEWRLRSMKFSTVLREVWACLPMTKYEVLITDFAGKSIREIAEYSIDILHETDKLDHVLKR